MIRNPLTGRLVKIGGSTYKKLDKTGVIQKHYCLTSFMDMPDEIIKEIWDRVEHVKDRLNLKLTNKRINEVVGSIVNSHKVIYQITDCYPYDKKIVFHDADETQPFRRSRELFIEPRSAVYLVVVEHKIGISVPDIINQKTLIQLNMTFEKAKTEWKKRRHFYELSRKFDKKPIDIKLYDYICVFESDKTGHVINSFTTMCCK